MDSGLRNQLVNSREGLILWAQITREIRMRAESLWEWQACVMLAALAARVSPQPKALAILPSSLVISQPRAKENSA